MSTESENTIPAEASVTLNVRYGYQDNDFRQAIDLPAGEHPTAQQLSHLLIGVFDAAAASENLDLHAGEKPRVVQKGDVLGLFPSPQAIIDDVAFRMRPAGQVVPPSAFAKDFGVAYKTAGEVQAMLEDMDREREQAVLEMEKQIRRAECAEDLVELQRNELQTAAEETRIAQRRAAELEERTEYAEKQAEELATANARLNAQLDDAIRTALARLNTVNRLEALVRDIIRLAQDGNA